MSQKIDRLSIQETNPLVAQEDNSSMTQSDSEDAIAFNSRAPYTVPCAHCWGTTAESDESACNACQGWGLLKLNSLADAKSWLSHTPTPLLQFPWMSTTSQALILQAASDIPLVRDAVLCGLSEMRPLALTTSVLPWLRNLIIGSPGARVRAACELYRLAWLKHDVKEVRLLAIALIGQSSTESLSEFYRPVPDSLE